MSYAIRATRIEDGQTKFWADGHPVWWVCEEYRGAKYSTVGEAHRDMRHKLTHMSLDSFCIDIVPVQS